MKTLIITGVVGGEEDNGDAVRDAIEPADKEEDSDSGEDGLFNDTEVGDALEFLSR